MEFFMKKQRWILIILLIIVIIGISAFLFYKFSHSKIKDEYSASKMSAENQNSSNNTKNSNEINNSNDAESKNNENSVKSANSNELNQNNSLSNSNQNLNTQDDSIKNVNQNLENKINENVTNKNLGNSQDNTSKTKNSDELISTFSTKIYTKESERQTNVTLTCNSLNNTIVKNGSTFSFCNTLGPATASQGYKKADVFDQNGSIQKGLGGGKCQVSSTLYNAILKVPNLVVTERHQHSNKVPYVEKGKDAAVAYR